MIYNPLQEYENTLNAKHYENMSSYFLQLVDKSGVDIEQNRQTVQQYNDLKLNLKKLKSKYNWLRFFRVIMCITVLLIPVVILKITPIIKELRCEIEEADKRAEELLKLAYEQMAPLNRLFTYKDALHIIETTIPSIKFNDCFSVEQEADMIINYDYVDHSDVEQSTLDVLSGKYNGNPFLFENKIIHKMGTETYHGYKTISWEESYRDNNGNYKTRTRTETLHASVIKPKPYYSTQVVLNYGSQGGPELSFSRDATNLDNKSERSIERYVKKGEKKLKKKTDKAISNNSDFMSMSNTEFEVLFDALDRTNEVQFRTLFTPLAQTNMVDLILSKTGYGDDFNFIKQNRMNRIISQHSQGRDMIINPADYVSYDYDVVKDSFYNLNVKFFKDVYFDFAPILAIPIYQEKPVQSLNPIPDYDQLYSLKESEALANIVDKSYVVHPDTKTTAILKSDFVKASNGIDENRITAYSYDIYNRVDIIPVKGGDGYYHDVHVPWDEYFPLEATNTFYIAGVDRAYDKNVIASRNGLCIFN